MKNCNVYYVYKHINKNTNEVFYIGKGSFDRAYSINSRNLYWKEYTKENEYIVEIVNDNLTEEESFKIELDLIAQYGIDNLTNIRDEKNRKVIIKPIDLIIDSSNYDEDIKTRMKNICSW
jgi:hypothetical protein